MHRSLCGHAAWVECADPWIDDCSATDRVQVLMQTQTSRDSSPLNDKHDPEEVSAHIGVASTQPARIPGQQHTGRFAVVDDVERFGLHQAIDLLCREGSVGLFAHTRRELDTFSAALQRAGVNATPHYWDLHHAKAADTLAPGERVLNAHGHDGTQLLVREDWGAEITQRCQDLMQRCGVMPASPLTLRGKAVPSLLAIASNATGQILGVGSLIWGHCQDSAWRTYAHLGMVCVDSNARGQSLGKRLAAVLTQRAAQAVGTAGITAACASDNLASANLLRACGLQRDSQRFCVMFTQDGERRTR